MKKILVISGNDPHGLAGNALDIKTVAALGCHALPVITALTTQDIHGAGVSQPVSPEMLRSQLNAFRETSLDAIKIGLIPNRELLEVVCEFLATREDAFSVLDPVGFSSGGSRLSELQPKDFLTLASLIDLITPNIPEAELLAGIPLKTPDEIQKAGEILKRDWNAVLIKGGHGMEVTDTLFLEDQLIRFAGEKLPLECRGTGCALSSAIASFFALGLSLEAAVRSAKAFVQDAIRNSVEIETGVRVLGISRSAVQATEVRLERVSVTIDKNILKVQHLVNELKKLDVAHLLPEIQANIAYAEGNPSSFQEVVGVPGRLVRFGKSFETVALPAYGATRHIAKVLLTCKRKDPSVTTVIDIAYTPELVERLRELGYSAGHFSRANEPADIRELEGSSLEWGTGEAIRKAGFVPDFIYDEGGMGKEPVIRLIARKPETIVTMIQGLL